MTTQQSQHPIITCRCPKCGGEVKFYAPAQPGVAKVTCPHAECGQAFGVKINEKQIHLGQPQPANQRHPAEPSQPQAQPMSRPTDPNFLTSGTPSGVMARLLQKKRHFFQKNVCHPLQLGPNTLGMYDPASPSDIMVPGDRTISHRSVTLTVETQGTSYKYLFTVNRAKNPVYLSGREVAEGTSVYLQIGQEFVLGRTRFCLINP